MQFGYLAAFDPVSNTQKEKNEKSVNLQSSGPTGNNPINQSVGNSINQPGTTPSAQNKQIQQFPNCFQMCTQQCQASGSFDSSSSNGKQSQDVGRQNGSRQNNGRNNDNSSQGNTKSKKGKGRKNNGKNGNKQQASEEFGSFNNKNEPKSSLGSSKT